MDKLYSWLIEKMSGPETASETASETRLQYVATI